METDMSPHTCCQCGNDIPADEAAHSWGRGTYACAHCHHAAAAYQGDTDEPIDEGLAYQDRLDGWHGPHHG
jgi:hypothetical protein